MPRVDWNERIHVGDKFGRLTVVELPEGLKKDTKIHCRCECGKEAKVGLRELLRGHTRSCGCLWREAMPKAGYSTKRKDWYRNFVHVGDKYGRLTILELPDDLVSNSMIMCKCECGCKKEVRLLHLLSHHTLSCGCLLSEYLAFCEKEGEIPFPEFCLKRGYFIDLLEESGYIRYCILNGCFFDILEKMGYVDGAK